MKWTTLTVYLQIIESTPYQNFTYALKSKDVKRQYPVMLLRFLNFTKVTGESIDEKCVSLYEFAKEIDNRKALESKLMEYVRFQEERISRKEINAGTLRNYIKAVKHFFVMNDILLNWDKIKKGVPTFTQTSNDRNPEILEIKTLLAYNDIRINPIVLTMLSSGIRVGAWNWLKWKNIIPIVINGVIKCAKIIVYYGEPDQYFSFITPEAYQALNDYMNFRRLHGEKVDGHRIGQAGKPKKFDSEGIRRLIYDSWKVQGVLTVHDSSSTEKHQPFKSSHGFRKFFETECEMVMKSIDVEILMGHGFSKRGLKANYYRPSDNYLLEQYLKAVDLLTISEENKLSNHVRTLEEKDKQNQDIINEKLQEKDDAYITLSDQVMKLMEEVQQLKTTRSR